MEVKGCGPKHACIIAYIAGLIDGEGWISIQFHKDPRKARGFTTSLVLGIANTNKEVLEFVKAHLGGNVLVQAKKYKGRKFTLYSWQVYSNNATLILKDVYPYLIIKKQHALVGIAFQLMLNAERGEAMSDKRMDVTKKMCKLNGHMEVYEKWEQRR